MLQNSITLTGRIFDVELKDVGNDNVVANANISFKTSKEETYNNISLVFWNKTAQRAEKLLTSKKGINAIVDGRIQQNKWKNEDGETRSRVQIVVGGFVVLADSNFQSIGKSDDVETESAKKSTPKPKPKKSQPKPQPKEEEDDEDLFAGEPF